MSNHVITIARSYGSGGRKMGRMLAKELGVDDVVCFTGEQKNPFPYMKHADLFALYSAYEGYPMVIGEAVALETKILTVNYAAAKEQISPQQGVIAESDAAFYLTLKNMIQASAKRKDEPVCQN